MLLDLANYIDREVVIKGGYELSAVERMVRVIQEGGYDAFVDIGANIGLYAIAIARGTDAEVVAFEPDPRNRYQMAGNLFLNQLETAVTLRPEAVTERDGQSVLRAQRAAGALSTGQSSLVRDVAGAVSLSVRTVALDNVLTWRGRRIAIKMDIESAELIAIRGMPRLLSENKVFMQIEIVPSNLDEARRLLSVCHLIEVSDTSLDPGNHYFVSAETRES
jgi:FkbM family methyltransferase